MSMDSKKWYPLLREIMEIGFVVLELNLYLDTHPHDVQALRIYNEMARKYHRLVDQFQRNYGMLLSGSVDYTDPGVWNWIEGLPWPWEIEYR